jgi:uncharacterized membrane protein
MDGATVSLFLATFAAAFVEGVETLTIVLAMGVSRDWRSTWAGVVAGLLALVGFTVVAGYAVATWLPEAVLQLVVGALLLVFGLQWLRKAVLRTSGRKALTDEVREFAEQTAAGRSAPRRRRLGIDAFAFVVALKGVFLEGVEVVFIVVTFGLSAGDLPTAVVAAVAATALVVVAGVALRRPLAAVPENTLKYVVGLLLATFGTYWAVQGVGVLLPGREVLQWPGDDLALVCLLAAWFLLSRALVLALRRGGEPAAHRPDTSTPALDAQ